MSRIEANALIKGDSLMDVYGWGHEEKLLLVQKLLTVSDDRGVDLYQAYNIDREEWAGVTTEDVLFLDERISETESNYPEAHHIIVEGPKLHIFKKQIA